MAGRMAEWHCARAVTQVARVRFPLPAPLTIMWRTTGATLGWPGLPSGQPKLNCPPTGQSKGLFIIFFLTILNFEFESFFVVGKNYIL